jgi:hypothetical protein
MEGPGFPKAQEMSKQFAKLSKHLFDLRPA